MLRQTLGTHVRQAGSLVAPDRLRFDYMHFEAPARQQLDAIEAAVAEWVVRDRPVTWTVLPPRRGQAARRDGAVRREVRRRRARGHGGGVEDAGIPVSRELCGGTHVARTGEIGAFVIVSDASIASGVRRIEALCGHEALAHMRGESASLHAIAAELQASPAAALEQVQKLRGEIERLRKSLAEHERGGLESEMTKLATSATASPQGKWIVAELDVAADMNAVRDAADRLRGALGRGAALLAIKGDGKLTFLAAVSDDLVAEKKLRADELVRAVAKVTGGSGGGKPHLALAGGKDLSKLADALAEARRLIGEALG
jgi:alanyl-tRNA synthetase